MFRTYPWPLHLLRLVSILVALPAAVTYAHLRNLLRRTETCLVGPAPSPAPAPSPRSAAAGGAAARVVSKIDRSADAPALDPSELYGMYRPVPGLTSPQAMVSGDGRTFARVRAARRLPPGPLERILRPMWGWPSASWVETELAAPGSSLLRRGWWPSRGEDDDAGSAEVPPVLQFFPGEGGGRWCARTRDAGEGEAPCSDPMGARGGDDGEDAARRFPPGGVWSFSGSEAASAVLVSCPGPPNGGSEARGGGGALSGWFGTGSRRNPNRRRNSEPNRNVEQVVRRPATTLLLALNVGLAFCYWNNRVDPSSVSKIYVKIVHEYEIWRSFTGATAHFEPLHIGFNMMSLYSLGTELEEGYGSIPFLFYNVALVVLTTAVMMGITYARIRYTGNAALSEVSTVGYSGVLFAWMVVASLERHSTCPVPFAPDVCFDTYSLLGGLIRFNLSPIVQLFVAQFIMPRVSFVGHLAGILCGFALHWNLIPLELASPHVLIPAALLAHLRFVRGLVPVSDPQGEGAEDDCTEMASLSGGAAGGTRGEEVGGAPGAPRRGGRDGEHGRRALRPLTRARNAMAATTAASVALADPTGSVVLSQALALAFFWCGVKSSTRLRSLRVSPDSRPEGHCERGLEMRRGGAVWRGAAVALTLTVAADSMAMASWAAAGPYVRAGRDLAFGGAAAIASAFVLCRIAVNMVGLALASGVLHDTGEVDGGIFRLVLGPVLRWARGAWDGAPSLVTRPPFEGRGVALGSLSSRGGGGGGGGDGGHVL